MNGNFVWRDAGRVVVFREEGVEQAPQLLAESGMERFELLSTGRHLDGAATLASSAVAVHEVPAAPTPAAGVPDAAAALLDSVRAENLVALGGGRAAEASPPRRQDPPAGNACTPAV